MNITELGSWVEVNEALLELLNKFEPRTEIDERNQLFLPMKRNRSHLQDLALSKHFHPHNEELLNKTGLRHYQNDD